MSQTRTFTLAAMLLLIACCVTGCRISSHSKNGKEDVSIDTPLGGLAVKTDPGAVLSRIGLPQYPGSVPVNDNGTNKDSADVNLSFGSFHLRVLAAAFQTGDDPSKVEAFYRKALAQYSDVIACRNDQPVGTPVKTGLGLTCKSDRHVHTETSSDGPVKVHHDFTLKAGSPERQHIVGMHPEDGGTRLSLVALDLPKSNDDSN